MGDASYHHYQTIARAIRYIAENFDRQPSLEEIALHIHLSPSHFQRVFTAWAGTSPKKFLQYISVQYAKNLLRQRQSLLHTSLETGLSSTSRLHDLFIQLEGMTPATFKNGGRHLHIRYQIAPSPFGEILIASTEKGICSMSFLEDSGADTALGKLQEQFPQASFLPEKDPMQQDALAIFENDWTNLPQIKLHLRGTPFQLKVWECLLRIPQGKLISYQDLAREIGHPHASRSVGTAIGRNPVAYLIPCHRVIRSSGSIGEYRWGAAQKMALIGWDATKSSPQENLYTNEDPKV